VDPLFEVHKLNDRGLAQAKAIAAAFDTLLSQLSSLCSGNTREFSIVKTKLEEACFFAKKSMANLVDNQDRAQAAGG
jgi:hypothetical protein